MNEPKNPSNIFPLSCWLWIFFPPLTNDFLMCNLDMPVCDGALCWRMGCSEPVTGVQTFGALSSHRACSACTGVVNKLLRVSTFCKMKAGMRVPCSWFVPVVRICRASGTHPAGKMKRYKGTRSMIMSFATPCLVGIDSLED